MNSDGVVLPRSNSPFRKSRSDGISPSRRRRGAGGRKLHSKEVIDVLRHVFGEEKPIQPREAIPVRFGSRSPSSVVGSKCAKLDPKNGRLYLVKARVQSDRPDGVFARSTMITKAADSGQQLLIVGEDHAPIP